MDLSLSFCFGSELRYGCYDVFLYFGLSVYGL